MAPRTEPPTSAPDPPCEADPTGEDEHRLVPPAGGWPVRVTTRGQHGRGVLTTRPVAAGEVCEVAAVMVVPDEADLGGFDHVFDIGGSSGVAGGVVSFVNHSYTPNCAYDIDPDDLLVTLYALRDLAPGTEVLVNYNGTPDSTAPLWFEPT